MYIYNVLIFSCVGIEEYQAQDIDVYVCPKCQPIHGPLVCKKLFTYIIALFALFFTFLPIKIE